MILVTIRNFNGHTVPFFWPTYLLDYRVLYNLLRRRGGGARLGLIWLLDFIIQCSGALAAVHTFQYTSSQNLE